MRRYKAVLLVLVVVAGMVLTGCGGSSGKDQSWAKIKGKGEIVVGIDKNLPPMVFEENGMLTGFDIDAATYVCNRLEIELKLRPIDMDSKKQELEKGNIDCIWGGLPIKDESNKNILFTKPYFKNRQVLVVNSYSQLNGLSEFKGKKIAVVAGSRAEDALNGAAGFKSSLKEVVKQKNYEAALMELKQGNVDAVLMDEAAACYYITMKAESCRIIEEGLSAEEYGIGFREKDKALMSKFQETLIEMAAERVLEDISLKWFGKDLTGFKEEAAVKKFNAQFIGRFDFSDPYGPVFGWPGSYIKARFRGTGLRMIMRPTNAAEKDSWFNIIIDDREPVPLHVDEDKIYTVASGLADGEHEITVWKRTGAANGELQFLGFLPDEGGKMLPPPPRARRRIEFIGDSVICGYGNEASSSDEGYKASQENNYLSFSSVAARKLDAEHISIAWGGKGVYRNYNGETRDTIPDLYTRILPKNAEKHWDFGDWIPQAVVINLGTNDFSRPDVDTGAFMQAYSKLIKTVRGNYSGAHIFCVVGPMDHRAKDYVKKIVEDFNEQGDKKVHYVEIPIMDPETEGVGGDSHPSVKTHLRAGKQLAEEIREKLGW